jgi:hydrocephalus-inducing protein
VIREGVDVDVQLKAKGEGQTIFYKDDLENVNFGVLYTCRPMTKDIFVENKDGKKETES